MAEQNRDTELSGRKAIRDKLQSIYDDVWQGFQAQARRSDAIMDNWDAYNAILGARQFYNGNSEIFVPIICDAVNARKTRFTNQIFPTSGRYVEVISEDGEEPNAIMALLEHYVRQARMRTLVMPAMMVNGDVEGQYNVCVTWEERPRHVIWRKLHGTMVEGAEVDDEQHEDIEEEEIVDAGPRVEVLHDTDTLILPATSDTVDDALASGGTVTIIRRWSKGKLRQMADDGEIIRARADDAIEMLQSASTNADLGQKNAAKELLDDAGIKAGGKFFLIWEVWARLKVEGSMRLVRAYYAGRELVLGCKLCPYWNDRPTLISWPVNKLSGVSKGKAPVDACLDMQIAANDAVNMGMDSANYALLPIVMTDPEKNPRTATMIMAMAAIWETSPKDTQFATFPQLWKDAFAIVQTAKTQIFQSLSVTPAMIPQQTGGSQKRNQAEIFAEQQVDILTTADVVTTIEEGILTPIIERFAEYDHQFRREDIAVRSFGMLELKAEMQTIPPMQLGKRWAYRWFGVEQARTAQQIQQQIAATNVIRGIPPELYPGRTLDLVPVLEHLMTNVFGPRLAPLVFKDIKDQLTMDQDEENLLLLDGFDMPVHPLDNDQEHLQKLRPLLADDPHGVAREHAQKHLMSMQLKAKAQMQRVMPGQPGGPGGLPPRPGQPPAGPGIPGQPPPGAVPQGPRPMQGPPGMIRPDNMPLAMPRRA